MKAHTCKLLKAYIKHQNKIRNGKYGPYLYPYIMISNKGGQISGGSAGIRLISEETLHGQSMIISYCPFCGAKLLIDEAEESKLKEVKLTEKKMPKKTVTIKNAKLYKPAKSGSKKGTKIEMEHTPQKKVANIIAGNHEEEHKDYYDKKKGLPAMEKKLNKSKGKKK